MKSLAARVAGIVRAPRVTVAELSAASRAPWLDVLGVSTLISFVSLAGLLATTVGQTALVDQWERTATAFGRPVDDALYARFRDLSTHGLLYSGGLAVLTGPVLTAVAAAIIMALLRVAGRRQVHVTTVLSIAAHASVIVALRQLVAAPINYLSETLTSPTTLAQLMAGLDEVSPLARFLGIIDLFVVWWAIVLAIGVAALTNRRVLPLALMFTGVYLAFALLLALAMAATGGTA